MTYEYFYFLLESGTRIRVCFFLASYIIFFLRRYGAA